MPYQIVVDTHGVITPQPLAPGEGFHNAGQSTLQRSTIEDFWRWAYSDLVGNTDRGALAEFIVAKAIDDASPTRNAWEPFDLTTASGIKVEVKSASFAQSWHQKQHTRVQFSIKKTMEWDPRTNDFLAPASRHSDVYVFCLLAEMVKESLNPLDLEQWEFYVLATKQIDQDFGDRQSVSLKQVKDRTSCHPVDKLSAAVSQALNRPVGERPI